MYAIESALAAGAATASTQSAVMRVRIFMGGASANRPPRRDGHVPHFFPYDGGGRTPRVLGGELLLLLALFEPGLGVGGAQLVALAGVRVGLGEDLVGLQRPRDPLAAGAREHAH